MFISHKLEVTTGVIAAECTGPSQKPEFSEQSKVTMYLVAKYISCGHLLWLPQADSKF